jgi:hypothetical protein
VYPETNAANYQNHFLFTPNATDNENCGNLMFWKKTYKPEVTGVGTFYDTLFVSHGNRLHFIPTYCFFLTVT